MDNRETCGFAFDWFFVYVWIGPRMAHGALRWGGKYKRTKDSCIRECGSTLYVGVAQGVSFFIYVGIEAKFQNMQKTGE